MTFTVSPWLVWAGTCLALSGLVWLARGAWHEVRGAAGWLANWLQGRIDPPWWWKPWLYRRTEVYEDELLEDDRIIAGKCEACWAENGGEGCDWAMCGCACHDDDGLPPLPPERSWEQMTAHQLPVVGMSPAERKDWQRLERNRKRRAKRVEMTYRAHYAAMGYEFPSGLMARVRELTP